jgi:predicted metalloendopeptidase
VRDDKSGDDKRNGNKQGVGSLYRDHKIGFAYDKMGSMTGKTGTTTDKWTNSTRTDDPQQKNAVKIGSLYDNKKIIWI